MHGYRTWWLLLLACWLTPAAADQISRTEIDKWFKMVLADRQALQERVEELGIRVEVPNLLPREMSDRWRRIDETLSSAESDDLPWDAYAFMYMSILGVSSIEHPSVGAILAGDTLEQSVLGCSATLVGCDLVATAAHCLDGLRDGLESDPKYWIYLQHSGLHELDTETVEFCDEVATCNQDAAIIKTIEPISGVAPLPLASPEESYLDVGVMVGFGKANAGGFDWGLKRQIGVNVQNCGGDLCTTGIDSGASICGSDSGGPLIGQDGNTFAPALLGIAGNSNTNCTPPNYYASLLNPGVEAWATGVIGDNANQCGVEREVLSNSLGEYLALDETFDTGTAQSWLLLTAQTKAWAPRVSLNYERSDSRLDAAVAPLNSFLFQGFGVECQTVTNALQTCSVDGEKLWAPSHVISIFADGGLGAYQTVMTTGGPFVFDPIWFWLYWPPHLHVLD